MRYGKVDTLLRLAQELQAAPDGLSLAEIGEKFGVGRRTAMRMRDAVLRSFPQTVEVRTGGRTKRWHIPDGPLGSDHPAVVTAEELAAMDSAVGLLRREEKEKEAALLAELSAKLKSLAGFAARRP